MKIGVIVITLGIDVGWLCLPTILVRERNLSYLSIDLTTMTVYGWYLAYKCPYRNSIKDHILILDLRNMEGEKRLL